MCRYAFRGILSVALYAGLWGCQFEDKQNDALNSRRTATEVVKNLPNFQLRVFYMPGAEPYTGQLSGSRSPVWSIVERSIVHVLPPNVTNVSVPYSLNQMETINLRYREKWGNRRLKRIATNVSFAQAGENINTISVIFLDGFYRRNEQAIGLHFSGTPVVFLFKSSIEMLGGNRVEQQIAEQSVIVHELGHAIGLVDGRVPMVADHQDHNSPGHCSNPNCIMYAENNGRRTAMKFVQEYRRTGTTKLFWPRVFTRYQSLLLETKSVGYYQ